MSLTATAAATLQLLRVNTSTPFPFTEDDSERAKPTETHSASGFAPTRGSSRPNERWRSQVLPQQIGTGSSRRRSSVETTVLSAERELTARAGTTAGVAVRAQAGINRCREPS